MFPGLFLLAALALTILASLVSLILLAPGGEAGLSGYAYLASIAGFTVLQASFSALLSLILGASLALALARRYFPGRRIFLLVPYRDTHGGMSTPTAVFRPIIRESARDRLVIRPG